MESVLQCQSRASVRWATERDFDPLLPTISVLTVYFLALVQERKLKIQTVKGHRTVIFTTLLNNWCGRRDSSSNIVLHDLLKLQVAAERSSILTKWNAFLVFHYCFQTANNTFGYYPVNLLIQNDEFLLFSTIVSIMSLFI